MKKATETPKQHFVHADQGLVQRMKGFQLGGLAALVAMSLPLTVGCAATATEQDQAQEVSVTQQALDATADQVALEALREAPHKAVCSAGRADEARCHARIRTTTAGDVVSTAAPSGFGPADLVSAYAVPASTSTHPLVAIIDAYDDPKAEADLAVYRSQYGLPACTTANGCFKKVNQSGAASPLPSPNRGWAGEIALDIQMVSAVCPQCKILLVEATSNSMTNLGTAVNTAASMGAVAISNSYGSSEYSSETVVDATYFNHPGIFVTASSGDNGYGVSYPAASPYVVGVGGTTLTRSTSSRGWAESVWSGAGSGCSRYESKPSFQQDTGCRKRTVADVSAVANPSSGVAVYDTYGSSGWVVYGGTSVAAPIVAAVFAATGKAGVARGWAYSHTSSFYDVTSGKNGNCSPSYLCTGVTGYDGPSGLGTPNGQSIAAN